MTERTGGSDVSRTETHAVADSKGESKELGPWRVDGHKWFTSGVDGDATVLLAQVRDEKSLDKTYLTPFFARMYVPDAVSDREEKKATLDNITIMNLRMPKHDRRLNSVRIVRLKRKLDTISLPTAELELENMRAHALGPLGSGICVITPILTLTRIHSAIAMLGYLGRGLQIARAFSLRREVGSGKGRRRRLWKMEAYMDFLAGV